MSLDKLVNAVVISGAVEKEVELFLPPEYEYDQDTWRQVVHAYAVRHPDGVWVKIAGPILQYLKSLKTEGTDWEHIVKASNFREAESGRFVCDVTFKKDKGGLAALYVTKVEKLSLIPISPDNKSPAISHISLSYIP